MRTRNGKHTDYVTQKRCVLYYIRPSTSAESYNEQVQPLSRLMIDPSEMKQIDIDGFLRMAIVLTRR